jgi:hypothetical protein
MYRAGSGPRRNEVRAELTDQPEEILQVPRLDDHAALEVMDVEGPEFGPPAGGGNAERRTGLGAATDRPTDRTATLLPSAERPLTPRWFPFT